MKWNNCISFFCGLIFPLLSPAQGIIIPANGYVISGNGNIVVSNNWVNNGSFTHSSGAVIFAGSTQSISGSSATVFNNITVNSGSNTTINTSGHVLDKILLCNGTLNANGNLTLRSTTIKTAAIDGSGSGEVLGSVILQRYVSSGFGYKYVSSPFQNDTVGDFSNDMNLSASFPTFYRHDENQASNGWFTYTASSGVLNPMYGYAANLGASNAAKTIDLHGVVNNHTVSRTLYNHNMPYTQGFNLVGNPYPSPINWDAAGGWTKTNIDNAVYYFRAGISDQYTGAYSSYVNGVSSDGAVSNIIASMQGFFVHVSDGAYPVTGLLSVNNTARTLNLTAPFFKKNDEQDKALLRMTVGYDNQQALSDAVTIYLDNTATGSSFNKNLDALKILNTEPGIPNIYAMSGDNRKLSIQAISLLKDSLVTVPLELITKKDGIVQFNAKDIDAIPEKFHIYLYDALTEKHYDIREEAVTSIMLTEASYENRFFLKFSIKDLIKVESNIPTPNEETKIYAVGSNLFARINITEGNKASLSIINMAGQVVHKQEINNNVQKIIPLNVASGVYIVHVVAGKKTLSQKILIAK